jgi:hypothetical protein
LEKVHFEQNGACSCIRELGQLKIIFSQMHFRAYLTENPAPNEKEL